jgi:hypothetical protein
MGSNYILNAGFACLRFAPAVVNSIARHGGSR